MSRERPQEQRTWPHSRVALLRTCHVALALCCLMALAGCSQGASSNAPAPHPYRVGVLVAQDPADGAALLDTLRSVLNTNGWTEGRNYVLDVRYASFHIDTFPSLIASLVQDKPDVIFAGTDGGAKVALAATSTIPLVSVMCSDPVQEGLIRSLAHPGGNLTGVLTGCIGGQIHAKQLQLLLQTVPGARRVGVLLDPTLDRAQATRQELAAAAPSLGVQLQFLDLPQGADVSAVLAAPEAAGLDALLVPGFDLLVDTGNDFLAAIARTRLPAMYDQPSYAVAGGLMAYGANLTELRRQAFMYLKQILLGAKPADLPVVQPTKFELVINLRTATALGLTVPETVLAQATDVIRPATPTPAPR